MENLPEKSSKGLFLHSKILEGYGCKNCVWKTYGQCPHKFTKPEQGLKEGFCKELAEFILGLAEKNDSISAVKEKFILYIQEMQVMSDHSEFNKVLQKYKAFKENEDYDPNDKEHQKKLAILEMEMNSYKIWWSRLSETVSKGLSKIVDREYRSKDVETGQKITIQQLNVLLKESDETLKEIK